MKIQDVFARLNAKIIGLCQRVLALESASVADGNGIYDGDGTVPAAATATLAGQMNIIGAGGGRELYMEVGDGIGTLSFVDMLPASLEAGYEDTVIDSTLLFDEDGITARNFINLLSYTPSGVGDAAGIPGSICWDDTFLYVKTSAGWKAVALP